MPRRLFSLFEPDDLSGLFAWQKADALVLSNGDPVASWDDSSGHSNAPVQATAGAKPTFTTGGPKGLPYLHFDGGDRLSYPDETAFDIVTPTIFVVARRTAGSSGSIIAKNTTSFTDGRRRKMQINTGSSSISYSSGSDSQSVGLTATPTNWNMFVIRTNSDTNHSVFLNGAQTDFGTTALQDSVLNNAAMEMGAAFSNGSEAFTGDVAEIFYFNRSLALFEIVGLENYLAAKYDLTVTLELGGTPRVPISGRVAVPGRVSKWEGIVP